jgi:hypothetical protein
MLRDLDPTARRYRAVVVGVTDYDDEDEDFNPRNDPRALHYVLMRLRWRDIPDLAWSYQGWQERWQVFRGGLFRAIPLQQDILAFLANPRRRIAKVRQYHEGAEDWFYDYVETDRSLAGLEINWNTWQVKYPPHADDEQRGTIENLMRLGSPQTGNVAAFRREWLGRIVDRYRGSRTRVIFVRLPRAPIPRPDGLVQKRSSSIRELAARPNVLLAEEHLFDSLERPELFRDAMHLNRAGIARFSPMLAREIRRLLERAGHAL